MREELEDDLGALETMRGCLTCELDEELLPGCPYWCYKWGPREIEKEEKETEI